MATLKRNFRLIIINVTVCLIFLSLPVLSSPDFGTLSRMVHVPPFQRDFLSYVLMLVFFYLSYYVFIPRFYFKRKAAAFFLIVMACFVIVSLLPDLMVPRGRPWVGEQPIPGDPNFGRHDAFFDLVRALLQFTAIFFLSLYLRLNRRLRESENEKMRAEISYLKAQINPHFLFNTLNSLYALALEKSDEAPDAVLKLSAMMRYVVTESGNDYVPLEKEIGYIRDYIDWQKMRLADAGRLHFEVAGNPSGKVISPMLLIPFVENAFKHGLGTDDWSISIRIGIDERSLTLDIANTYSAGHPPEDPSGQGIGNTRKRLDFLYPGCHKLTIGQHDGNFRVHLEIQLS